MPDQPPYSWQQIVRDVIQALQVLALAWIATLGTQNKDKISGVQQQQAEVKEDLEAKAQKERRAIEVNLRSSWKYLDSLAVESGKQTDKDNAATAKKVLEDFLNHNGH